jgi:peptidoglycan/LPS O-acetylase OafA/YrhL
MNTDKFKSWEVEASTGKHFDVLDGIRGLAILMVVSYHTFYINPKSGVLFHVMGGINEGGWMGVQIFFVLSGFLISYPFFRQKAKNDQSWYPQNYARRRIGKIIPPYYLSLVIFASYYLIRFFDPAYLRVALGYALFSPNILPSGPLFNSSYWSLIVETQFYILLPLLFFLARGVRTRTTTLGMFALIWLIPVIARQLTWPGDDATPEQWATELTRFPCYLDSFAWGVLFAGMFVLRSGFRGELRSLSLFGYAGLALLGATLCFYAVSTHFFPYAHAQRWKMEAFHLLPSASTFLLLFFVFDPNCLGVRLLAQP